MLSVIRFFWPAFTIILNVALTWATLTHVKLGSLQVQVWQPLHMEYGGGGGE